MIAFMRFMLAASPTVKIANCCSNTSTDQERHQKRETSEQSSDQILPDQCFVFGPLSSCCWIAINDAAFGAVIATAGGVECISTPSLTNSLHVATALSTSLPTNPPTNPPTKNADTL
jgi:hypothetical protein